MKKQQLPGMIHLPLLVFLGIGFWQTGLGFEKLLGPVAAWGFSAGITLIMYYLSLNIGPKRLNNQPILGLTLFYLVCSLFSYAGNFNGVYTEYQEEQLYRDELLKHKTQLGDTIASSTKALHNFSPETDEKSLRVEQLTQQLIKQITDSARPGLGKRARDLIREIEGVLGEQLTEFGGTPQQLADKYSENINDIAKRKFSSGDLGRVNGLIEENQSKANEIDKKIEDLLFVGGSYIKQNGAKLNLEAVNVINDIGTKTVEFINNPKLYTFEKVHFESQEVGKIAFSFKSAFGSHPFIGFLLTIFCFFLDWAVVLYLIVRYRKDEAAPYEQRKQSSDL